MADNHDYVALDWLKGEIEGTLTQAQAALEDYVNNPEDSTKIRFCLNYIHQVHGTLQMVEFYGPALLAEEMEQLAQALLEGNLAHADEAVEVLMRAILQLLNYLGRLQSSRNDLPVILLPILNDLRASRGVGLLSDTSLFTPDLSLLRLPASPEAKARLQDQRVVAQIRKLRQMYQFSLVGVIRESDLDLNLGYMNKVFNRLQTLCRDSSFGQLWRISNAFVEALQQHSIELSSGTKNVLRTLDNSLKRLIDESADILGKTAPEDLAKHILYYLAQTDSDHPNIISIHQDFRLDKALPDEAMIAEERQRMAGPDQEAMDSVIAAVNEELAKVKDQLDLFVRREDKDIDDLIELMPGLQQVASTLEVLALDTPRRIIEDQIHFINRCDRNSVIPDDNDLMDIAEALLHVEATLAGNTEGADGQPSGTGDDGSLMPKDQVNSAHEAVIRESRNGLEQAKTSIVEYIASQWDKAEIEDVPALLQSIEGGLRIIPLTRAADLLNASSRYIKEQLLAREDPPDWSHLDTLADAITSIEYYLERLSEGGSDNDMVLEVADESLAQLGYPASDLARQAPPVPIVAPAAEPTQAPEAAHEKEPDKELIDSEIIEIFIEEAAEVLQTIHQHYPSFEVNPEDSHALAELRRAYHTLKGSGRLVGATTVADLAWSVENMLNRVIDDSVSTGLKMFELLEQVNAKLPELIEAFELGQEPADVTEYISAAEALAEASKQAQGAKKAEAAEAARQEAKEARQEEQATEPLAAPATPAESPAVAVAAETVEDDMIDDEIIEIFLEEAAEVLEAVAEYLPRFFASYDDQDALSELRRAFHTLKGSGRMVGAKVASELAWSVENLLNRVIEETVVMTDGCAALLRQVVNLYPDLVEDFEKRRPSSPDAATLTAQIDAFTKGEELTTQKATEPATPVSAPSAMGEVEIDPVLLDIFRTETESHLDTMEAFIRQARSHEHGLEITDELSRALHTLKGSANTADIKPIAAIAIPVEKFIKEARASAVAVDPIITEMLAEATDFIRKGLEHLATEPQQPIPGTDEFLTDLDQLTEQFLAEPDDALPTATKPDRQLTNLFLTEDIDILLDADRILKDWSENHSHTSEVQKLTNELTRLSEDAELAGLANVAALARSLESLYQKTAGTSPDDNDFYLVANQGQEALLNMMDQIAAGLTTQSQPDLIAEINEIAARPFRQRSAPGDTAETTGAPADRSKSKAATTDEQFFELDPELAEIFLEEAYDLIHSSAETMQRWSEDLTNDDLVRSLQRELHTLKGGARLTGVLPVGNLAHELESLFEGITEQRITPTEEACNLSLLAHDTLSGMIDSVASSSTCSDADDLIAALQGYISANRDKTEVEQPASFVPVKVPKPQKATPSAVGDIDTSHIDNEIYELSDLDQELVSLFLEEANELIESTANNLQAWLDDIDNIDEVKELQRALHTLKGGARLAEIKPIGDLAHELETLFEGIVEDRFNAEKSLARLMLQCHDRLAEMVDNITSEEPVAAANDLILRIHHYCNHHARGSLPVSDALSDIEHEQQLLQAVAGETSAEELRAIFLDESRDIMEAVTDCFDRWKADPDDIRPAKELARNLNTLTGGAKLANTDSVSSLAEALSRRMKSIADGQHQVSDEMIATIDRSLKYTLRLLSEIEALEEPGIPNELIGELNEMGAGQRIEKDEVKFDVDEEILQIFVEEAAELQGNIESEITAWSRDPRNHAHAEAIARSLHTLKGGARLATLTSIGDLAQELESIVNAASEQKAAHNDQLRGEIDLLLNRLKAEIRKINIYCEKAGAETAQAADAETTGKDELSERMVQIQREQSAQEKSNIDKPAPAKVQQRQAPVETVRVSAPLLDELVNLAGETSIARGLLEQQISDFTYTLEEMQATIDRLREQLRRMDIETEAQILFSVEKEGGPEYDDFDPLEMDRYSSIQQLSRALSESTFDLADLRETMLNKAKDAETLLLQQSRINTDLQEGLMKTRMVPFASSVPRLRRIVRQVCTELGKKVDFEVYNPEGELDRTVLERMVAPLEHMIRNAIGHGIELPADRSKAGKPETGKIELSLGREGGDVVMVLSDDGAGINIEAVRNKALAQGLIDANAAVSDHEVLQFIFHAGFSTAKKVTQLSGRGVGMDVVSSEIKQLGGRVSIDSKPGKGTRFVIHLPFTVSVNRALMVNIGEDYYAIPLSSIEGIVRVSTYELEEYYQPNAPLYEYAGQRYQLQYLGSLLKSGHYPKLQGQALPLPVILVRGSDEQPLALQVDSLMGSREIVVKSLGSQFAKVRGVSGATILGDGSVVVILDLPAMLHSDMTANIVLDEEAKAARADHTERPAKVMVVDDSITVRKVTSRLLERNGMEVLLAKDGVDAIALLQDNKPDVMLLDIEMPRMDGFEVASLMRHDENLKEVPIIMITSRTGQKHRDRAMAIGVNEYLGKPFQEGILLQTINKLVG